ncbi:DNA polymerase/3'-5' exonuclease PolX [Methanobacterium petrolearium]|uniref:DNA polymerase/3'-5' exonuclease PolX n=1 Tax=Methanobacterium petrolearium TaxID=710190 RepID=UPI001AEB9397|nr:DNA polymerase/3'-5' exonuclease PolX [Methanobacterium petrolearium]MBP1945192.1 DNA polymerase (family 10) [Methanobacterium petrolearium]BDZ71123.1 DNA polymerase/3'-5' exonuclease PolX [Methanobacterium petrolearium]
MQNKKVASILSRVADYLEMDGVDFRTKAYRRAAHTIETLSVDITDISRDGKLEELPGIGKHIAVKIKEILDTGKLQYLEDLEDEYPLDLNALMSVEGLGPKKIQLLFHELGIMTLDDLEKEAKRHHIRRLKGMGAKTEAKILQNLEFARKSTGRQLLGEVLPLAQEIAGRISALEGIRQVEIAGSIRRRKETVGDIDILTVTDHPDEVMDFFAHMDLVDEVIVKGHSKSTVRLYNGMDADIRVFKEEDFGSALLYFTGSRELNIQLRKIAISNKMKLNEYGVFQGDERLASRTEKDVFKVLGLDYIPPELRENTGEIEAAQEGKLPKLVGYDDIKGDLHLHTNWSDGKSSINQMANEAIDRGYEYLAITDHTSLPVARGMDDKRLKKQIVEIDKINSQMDNIAILKGVEVNLDPQGNLDISKDVLEELDMVIAAVHYDFRQEPGKMNKRILNAFENEYVDILAHPTGRKLKERQAYELDLEQLFQKATETGTILEVNSSPKRLDLKDIHVKMAVEHGCQLVVNTDAHHVHDLKNIQLGVATARRGWAEKKDIINTLPLKKLLKLLN